jgi:hypothetical protein
MNTVAQGVYVASALVHRAWDFELARASELRTHFEAHAIGASAGALLGMALLAEGMGVDANLIAHLVGAGRAQGREAVRRIRTASQARLAQDARS